MKLINWFKKIRKIVNSYDTDFKEILFAIEQHTKSIRLLNNSNKRIRYDMEEAINLIKERTTCNTDVHLTYDHMNSVVLIGQYCNTDYVEIFKVRNDHFSHLVKELKIQARYSRVDKIDAIPEIKLAIRREL